jgi:hypothetical protein
VPSRGSTLTRQNLRVSRRAATVLLALLLAGAAAGCGSSGSPTRCGVDGCTITFPRNGQTAVSVLGVDARLLGVQNGAADIEVAGQRISVPVGGETSVGDLTVGVERLTDTEVVVRVRP